MNNSEVIEAPQQRRDVTPLQTALAPLLGGPTQACGMSPCPNLSAAVAAARDKCKKAIKASYNEYHKFWYASADDVIDTANEALEGSGLAVLPLEGELVTVGSGNSMYFALNRLLVLTHSSGEFTPLKIRGWPVIPERGRPLDKAFAIALTSSLAYLLRDLLQMPRGKEEDTSAQDDRATPVQAQPDGTQEAPAVNPPPAPQAPEVLTEHEWASLVAIAQVNQRTREDIERVLAVLGVPVLKKSPRSALAWLERVLTNGLTTVEVTDRISAMVNELGLSWPAVGVRLESAYGVKSLALLTPTQASEVEAGLRKALAAKQPAPIPAASGVVPSAASAGS